MSVHHHNWASGSSVFAVSCTLKTAVGAVRSSVPSHGCQKHLSKQHLSQYLLSPSPKPPLCPWFSGGTAQLDGWDLLASPLGSSFQNAWSPGLLWGVRDPRLWLETSRGDVAEGGRCEYATTGACTSDSTYPVNCCPTTVTSWQHRTSR